MKDTDRKELHKKIWANLLWSLAVLLFLIFVLPRVFQFFLPMIIAWIIACIANPLVQFMEKHIKIMRKHGSVIVIVFVILMIGGLFYLVISGIATQVGSFVQEFPDLYQQVIMKLQESLSQMHEKIDFIPKNIQDIIGTNGEKLTNVLLSAFGGSENGVSFAKVSSLASSVLDYFIIVVLTLMLSYFFVAHREKVLTTFKRCMPEGVKGFWNMAQDTCLRALVGYLKACFKIMIVIFIELLILFGVVLQVKYSVLLAIITSILDFFPFLGTGFIIGPWAVYCFLTGDYFSTVILAVAYVLSLVIHRVLEPKLIGDSVGMSPFATLVSMFICYRLIGMLGLIVGIPLGMIITAFYEQGVFDSQIRGIKILFRDYNEYRKY